VTIPEERGSFRRFCELIGDPARRPAQRHRVQLPHQRRSKAHVFVGLTTQGKGESTKIAATSCATASPPWT
jgi:threonine dehydratase